MSEFSESYHLQAKDIAQGVALLKQAGLQGYVFPSTNGWVTLLSEGAAFEPNDRLIQANTGLLLHYIYAEDHGWSVELYKGSTLITAHSCVWDDDVRTTQALDLHAFDHAASTSLASLDGEEQRRIFEPTSFEEVFGEGLDSSPAYSFAERIGLTNYQWLSFEYLSRDQERGESLSPGVVAVR